MDTIKNTTNNNYIINVIIFLFIALFIFLGVYFYLTITAKKSNMNDILHLIKDEITLNENFNYEKTILELMKRENLLLPNNANTLIITWQMFLVNSGGEFYWNTNYNKDKPIIRIGNTPHIYYNPRNNKLKVVVAYQYSPFANQYPIIELENIELQRWNTFTVVFSEGFKVLIYLNGELVLSRHLDNGVKLNTIKTDIRIGELNNNIFGKLRDMTIYLNPMTHSQLKKINL